MITQLTQNSIGVQVPEGAEDIRVRPTNCLNYQVGVVIECPDLPEGNWKILGLGKDLSEEQCKSIVEEIVDNKFQVKYPDYYQKEPTKYKWEKELKKMGFINALASFESLLKSKGLQGENTLILIKQ